MNISQLVLRSEKFDNNNNNNNNIIIIIIIIIMKVLFTLEQATKVQWGSRGIALLFL